MFIIKPLIFIIINMLFGFIYVFAIKFFLFIPSKEKKINGKRIPLTPAFATIVFEVVKQFLRTFVPYLMEKYEVNKYIELLDKKLDVDIIKEYFNKYVYKYVLMFVLAVHFLIGFGNMLIYLCVK